MSLKKNKSDKTGKIIFQEREKKSKGCKNRNKNP